MTIATIQNELDRLRTELAATQRLAEGAETRATDAENRVSFLVSSRDLTIQQLRAELVALRADLAVRQNKNGDSEKAVNIAVIDWCCEGPNRDWSRRFPDAFSELVKHPMGQSALTTARDGLQPPIYAEWFAERLIAFFDAGIRQGKQKEKDALTRGIGLALAICQRTHDSPSVYIEVFRACGLSLDECKRVGLEEYDLASLREIVKGYNL